MVNEGTDGIKGVISITIWVIIIILCKHFSFPCFQSFILLKEKYQRNQKWQFCNISGQVSSWYLAIHLCSSPENISSIKVALKWSLNHSWFESLLFRKGKKQKLAYFRITIFCFYVDGDIPIDWRILWKYNCSWICLHPF